MVLQSNQKIRKLGQLYDFGCGLEFSPINKVEVMAAKEAEERVAAVGFVGSREATKCKDFLW
ncbi:hypothetical protein ACLOJK_034471 [Asimina triloba]